MASDSGEGCLLVISAPSGAGKSTLVKRLLLEEPRLGFSVSHTTRAPRPGERDGEHYHFVAAARFEAMAARGEFLEWARVHGNLYGTSQEEVASRTRSGLDVLLDIDVQGARTIRQAGVRATLVFLLPPSFDELRGRLVRRGTDGPQQIEERLRTAGEELRAATFYDHLVVNDDLEQAVADLRAVLRASRRGAVAMEPVRRRVLGSFPGVPA